MKKFITTLLFLLLLSSLYGQNNSTFYYKEDGMLYSSSNQSILSKQKWTWEEFQKSYPMGKQPSDPILWINGNGLIDNNTLLVIKIFPWVIWTPGMHDAFFDLGLAGDLRVRWVWFRYSKRNNLQNNPNSYFNGMHREPPKGFALDILNKFEITLNTRYRELLNSFGAMNKSRDAIFILPYPEDEPYGGVKFLKFFDNYQNTMSVLVHHKDDLYLWAFIYFDTQGKVMAVRFEGIFPKEDFRDSLNKD